MQLKKRGFPSPKTHDMRVQQVKERLKEIGMGETGLGKREDATKSLGVSASRN